MGGFADNITFTSVMLKGFKPTLYYSTEINNAKSVHVLMEEKAD